MTCRLLPILLALLLPLELLGARLWTPTKGAPFEAELLSRKGDSIVLMRLDGRREIRPLAQLSAADRAFVQEKFPWTPKAVPPPASPRQAPPTPPQVREAKETPMPKRDDWPRAAPMARAPVGQPPPALTGAYVGSPQGVTLESLRGKVVLVEFMSLQSDLYHRELPYLLAIHERYREMGFEVMTVCTDKVGRETLMDFVKHSGLSWILTHDRHHRAVERWGARTVPSRVLVNANGIVDVDQFAITDLETEIRRLLNLPKFSP